MLFIMLQCEKNKKREGEKSYGFIYIKLGVS